MRSMLGLLLLLAFTLLFSGCARWNLFRRAHTKQECETGLCIGKKTPDLDGMDFAGQPLKLSDYRGKVVVVSFWASGCGPCRAMIPHERELVERYRGKPFALLGVNNDENPDAARRVIAAHNISWPNLKTRGENDPLNKRWGIEFWPSIFVIDRQGVLRYKNVRGAHLDNAIETLLKEPAR
ncbi:MAG: TlpA family protein disulfide reductase [Planctomycetes bacterium]|jgi:thiol-disulfide isomerase/thioredoxin|nr:TlpA family protein disulfide reductase [Planctomycetota bacterium]